MRVNAVHVHLLLEEPGLILYAMACPGWSRVFSSLCGLHFAGSFLHVPLYSGRDGLFFVSRPFYDLQKLFIFATEDSRGSISVPSGLAGFAH